MIFIKPLNILFETDWEFGTGNPTQMGVQVTEYHNAMDELEGKYGENNIEIFRDMENNKLLYFLK